MKLNRPVVQGFGGFLSMVAGGCLMVILVISFQQGVVKKAIMVREETRIVTAKPKPRQIHQPEQTHEAPKGRKTSGPAPPPELGLMIGGIAMDIPEFASASVVGDSADLLDDIAEDMVMTEGTVDGKPRVTNRPPMEFPKRAAKDGIKGYVVVNLLIGEDGSVELARIIDSQPNGIFDETVLTGVKDWLFAPATYKGRPVKVWAKQKVSFNS